MPPILPISALFTSLGERLARASKVIVLEKDMKTARDGMAENTTRLEAAKNVRGVGSGPCKAEEGRRPFNDRGWRPRT